MTLDSLGLRPALARRLHEAGYDDVADLERAVPRELLAINHVGPSALLAVMAALKAQGKSLAIDPYALYVCARDGRAAQSVSLTDLWLCDSCAADFQTRPFDGISPVYVSEPIDGYCINCVQRKQDVALRQWFLCEDCARVARSFGSSVVASKGLLAEWDDRHRAATGIKLVEVDPPRLNRRHGAIAVATKPSAIDWEGREEASDRVVFGIEQKTGQKGLGRGSVNAMSEFQLDTSDCDDIAAVAERRNLPVYLLHAQVVERAHPPTRLYIPVAYWWTDAYSMGESRPNVRMRPRERRPAAYYPADIFRPLSDFAAYILAGGVDAFRARVRADGRFPAMYPNQPRRISASLAALAVVTATAAEATSK
jgi:hypothetical protein